MPSVSKWFLIPCVIVFALVNITLTVFVLECRRNWDLKVKAKAAEVAKAQQEVDELVHGKADVKKEFRELAKTVLNAGSQAANQEFDKKVNEGFDPRPAFEVAMNSFIDKRILDAHQEALRRLNDVQKIAPPDEIARDDARKAFEAAENDYQAAQRNLDAAYRNYLGIEGPGGIRNLLNKGMSVDDLRATLVHMRHVLAAEQTVHNTISSDWQKSITQVKDLWQQTAYEANTMRLAAENGMRELNENIKERDLTEMEYQREKVQLATEIEKRDMLIADLNDLQKRFDEKMDLTKELAKSVKVTETLIDQKRGLKGAVISSDGIVPKGKIQQIDENAGTLTINLGTRVGVRPGVQLEVYRFGENARYLGKLEVIRSDSDGAVARMLPEYRQVAIQAGDRVSSEITRDLNP
jgi:hypothetical protein